MSKNLITNYKNLYHGTSDIAAIRIMSEGFIPSKSEGKWCGEGIYFYDIELKALWYANNTCRKCSLPDRPKLKPAIISADIERIRRNDVLDLRTNKDVCDFKDFVSPILSSGKIKIEGEQCDTERRIKLRSILIGYYAKEKQKKLVIGIFRQRYQGMENEFIEELDIVSGVETIYCVKDGSILTNLKIESG